MKSTIQSANISKSGDQYLVTISYRDGTGSTDSFTTQDEAHKYLTEQNKESDTMAKNEPDTSNATNTDGLDFQDPHVNAPGVIKDTPEKAASDMTLEEAEAINSNVVAPVVPTGATSERVNVATNNLDADSENGSGNTVAPRTIENPSK